MNTISHPFIKPKFPPIINLRELITKQVSTDPSKNNSGRAPNAFIIYRKIFVETARKDGYQLPMTVVSLMASQSWELEPDVVKEEYKRLAKEANIIRNEIIPKSSRRRKREKWNIVSFPNTSSTCKAPIVVKSKSTIKKKQQMTVNSIKQVEILSPTSPVSPFEFESPKITFDIPFDIVSPIIDRFLDSDSVPDDPLQNNPPNTRDKFNLQQSTEFNKESIIGEQNVNNSIDSLIIQRDNIGYIYNEFEFDSQGFSSFNDDDTISYPSFWSEF
ncbi:3324_t:CDS:1 [Funneliformis mosseae]|uniref:3324_t:CDS:1 n=1 Tax=Funneliformis mosseae TaxID=27381 RepID=A0A9N8ZRW5_FUNMO|nr:3324_t:CDS:1 [Funneliformis mosseae]